MIYKIDAILSLVPTAKVTIRGEEVEWHEPSTAPITDAQINAELTRLKEEYDTKQYQRNRAIAYPSIQDQLDTLYHGGYEAWKATIEEVKQEFPKP